jgi:hypothetical protein
MMYCSAHTDLDARLSGEPSRAADQPEPVLACGLRGGGGADWNGCGSMVRYPRQPGV